MAREPTDSAPLDDHRTGYALDRTVLANERTYAAWLRTGLAALAGGIAIEKFMVEAMPTWTIRCIAMILITFSAVAFGLAGWRFTHLGIRLRGADVRMVPSQITTLVSVLLVGCSLLALVGIWLVP